MMTKKETEVAHLYHMILETAVKINIVLDLDQQQQLTTMLLKACDSEEETLFLQEAINYIRAVGEYK